MTESSDSGRSIVSKVFLISLCTLFGTGPFLVVRLWRLVVNQPNDQAVYLGLCLMLAGGIVAVPVALGSAVLALSDKSWRVVGVYAVLSLLCFIFLKA